MPAIRQDDREAGKPPTPPQSRKAAEPGRPGDFTRMFESRFEQRQPPPRATSTGRAEVTSAVLRLRHSERTDQHRGRAGPPGRQSGAGERSRSGSRASSPRGSVHRPSKPGGHARGVCSRTPNWSSTSTDMFGLGSKQDRRSTPESEPAPSEKRSPGEYTRVVRARTKARKRRRTADRERRQWFRRKRRRHGAVDHCGRLACGDSRHRHAAGAAGQLIRGAGCLVPGISSPAVAARSIPPPERENRPECRRRGCGRVRRLPTPDPSGSG